MSTLEYLDRDGNINFLLVPWTLLNQWLSKLNGNTNVPGLLPDGANRGKVIEELEARKQKKENSAQAIGLSVLGREPGYGRDWKTYENKEGYTHLEELLIYQPAAWRKQVREYMYRFEFDLQRTSSNESRVATLDVATLDNPRDVIEIQLVSPVMVVLFHPAIKRSRRYQPLNFLLAYGVGNPIPGLLKNLGKRLDEKVVLKELSPLDYFFEFQKYVLSYKLETLREVGKRSGFRRLYLLKELDFSDIIGQRLAKETIRSAVFQHVYNQTEEHELCANLKPLSMIFAGPSGTGKTELAVCLKDLLNKPGDTDTYIKIDCGQLTDKFEVFGGAGAYQGAKEGSALNNFVLRMSQDPDARGVVLLDELEKASPAVIHGLYQVLDKGEWTNKKLRDSTKAQTETVPCHNIIFIMTTNAADGEIEAMVKHDKSNKYYTVQGADEVEGVLFSLEASVKKALQSKHPFTKAFIGRVGRIVPFFPLAKGDPNECPLLGESLTVAKLLIERQQEKFLATGSNHNISQVVSAEAKHEMALIIVDEAIDEGGVRSIQKGVESKMANRMINALAREKEGIKPGSQVRYTASIEEKKIDFRLEKFGSNDPKESREENWSDDLF